MESTKQTIFKIYCCMFNNCGKEYTLRFNLKRHVEVIHFKSKEVVCEICNKSFRIKKNYLEHKMIHLSLKPYKCSLCSATFRHNSSFLKHKKNNLCILDSDSSSNEISYSEFED